MSQPLLITLRHEELETIADYPTVSIIMPFEPKMKSKGELLTTLSNALIKVEQQLLENFQMEMAMLVIPKLRVIIEDLNYSTHKKSIAIYVSPVFEKIFYLDMEVKEKIRIDNSFTIRDLVRSKKETHEYLLLVLNENESKVYLDDAETMLQVFAQSAEIFLAGNKQPYDNSTSFLNKYLRHIDLVLGTILPSFKAPLFVIGSEKIVEQFKNITTHSSAIIQYIHNVCENISPQEIKSLMQPLISCWGEIMKTNVHHQLANASGTKGIVSGIENVFRQAMYRRGRLLLVEENYKYPAKFESNNELIVSAIHPYSQLSYINDMVDDIIEKVLDEGGDVEFVDEDVLKDYGHIALIL